MVGRGTRLYPGKQNLLILDFLWLCQKHNLCKPACLASDNEEDIQKVTKRTETEQIELFGAVSDAEDARRNALAEALARQAKKKSKMINPLDLFDLLDDIGLADYQPTFKWEEKPASENQIKALNSYGVDTDDITRGYASAILDRLFRRSDQNLATLKQIKCLKRFGYDPVGWSFDQAKRTIGALAERGWKRW